ncbi:hypothetical protein XENTR_v10024994 [Xenopus tropicalis]|uniref:catechol O-methyltransferase n=3 Tax=Xenopus tropicalis TaxID=8364 RepID=F6U6U3_XENTR|nr:catechol O-methyltransferase A isoform X1 [Xenopus tropicalis]KAE8574149.1 hypothetical protein XENTR_v10024994 [Xenopus tropicalis]|eukprot:XP_017946146.1 PREDICTED: catechol O-methyltransferase-like isoform X1 [Xenopus tropicalis]
MLQVLLAVGMGALALLLFVVWRVRTDGAWALWWHDNYLERLRDFTSGQSRPMRILQFVQSAAAPGDANSAICAVDSYCANVEWAMNVGDKKGQILDAVVLAVRPRWVLELGTYCGYSTMRIARLLPPGARLVTLEMNQHYAQVAKQILGHAGLDTQLSPSPAPHTQGEEPVGGATQSPQGRWRLQEALIYTTLHCLQLPLQLFSRPPQNPLSPFCPKATEETAERQPAKRSSACKVDLLVGASSALIPQLKKKFEMETFDLIFIDHWKASYLPDARLLEECGLLAPGTVLLADNVTCPGAPDYLQYVRNSPRYRSEYFPCQLEYLQVEDGMEKSVFLG